jgi:glycine betaine/choline ABC-type transport system substrate-binding protein
VLRAVAAFEGRIDEARMQRLNLGVDRDGDTPSAVAEAFLRELGEGTP